MIIVKIKPNRNGSHANQSWPEYSVPDGYARIPDDMVCQNFPFGEITVEDDTVKSWTPLPIPEIGPVVSEPTEMDKLSAQVTYTALKTGTLIGGGK